MSNQTITPSVGAGAYAGIAASLFNQTTTGHLYVAEFGSQFNNLQSGSAHSRCPPLRTYCVPFAAVSVASLPFSPGTTSIRVHSDAVCSLSIGGKSPTASAGYSGSLRLATGATENFAVNAGDALAVIAAS